MPGRSKMYDGALSRHPTEYTKQEVAHRRHVVRNMGIPAQSQ